jgi:hypothetical protein
MNTVLEEWVLASGHLFSGFFLGGVGGLQVFVYVNMKSVLALNYTPHTKLTKASIKVFSSISKRKRTCPIVRKLFSGENRHVTPPATTSTAA